MGHILTSRGQPATELVNAGGLDETRNVSKTVAKRVRPVADLLRGGRSQAARLTARVERLASLDRALRKQLEPPLSEHVRLVALTDERATIWADSAAWRGRLHYQLPQIRRILESRLRLKVPRIETGVAPLDQRLVKPRRRAALSEQAAIGLKKAAATLDDEKLSKALERLAGRARSES